MLGHRLFNLAVTISFWSVGVFLCCGLVLGVSGVMFWLLERRWTRQRHWTQMTDWARANDWRLRRHRPPDPPRATEPLSETIQVAHGLESARAKLMQVDVATVADQPPTRWNLLVCTLEADWPPTGLRPSAAPVSFVDLFHLGVFVALSTAGRFTAVGADAAAARRLNNSAVRGLLPSDLGMLLVGNEIIVDFSSRPFDPITFDRLLAILQQILIHLPIAQRA